MKYSFKIGNLLINNPIFLAPMAGVTDRPFRLICKKRRWYDVYRVCEREWYN